MQRRAFGRHGFEVSLLGFGGAEIGFERTPPEEVDQILGEALDLGLNVVDTAECYAGGEILVGNALHQRRADFYLFTKVGHVHNVDEDEHIAGEDWEPGQMARTIDRSLRRLRTDCVDLLQLHSCSQEILEKGEVIEVLKRAKEAGKTRLIGYSGDNAPARWAVESGHFDALQTSFSIADQASHDLTLQLAAEKGMGIILKRPLANAAWLRGAPSAEGFVYWRGYHERLQKLSYDFLTQPDSASTALRFSAAAPGVSTMIVGTSRRGRFAQNAAALQAGPLPPDEFAAIRARWKEVAADDWVGEV